MTVKCTALFQLATNTSDPTAVARRLGGWSESYYRPDADIGSTLITNFNTLCQRRAALLPSGAVIVGQRFQVVNPAGTSQTAARRYPGTAGTQADVPQMALLCRAPAQSAANIRPLILRGIPDARVVEGEYSPSSGFTTAIESFFSWLSANWQFHGRDLSANTVPIYSIDALGVATLEANTTAVLGSMVRVLRTTDVNKDQVGGRFRVSAAASSTQITLQGWTLGACKGGRLRVDADTYLTIGSPISISRVITRRVGRPFEQYRGRQSKKR
jgi:hypothetical protein